MIDNNTCILCEYQQQFLSKNDSDVLMEHCMPVYNKVNNIYKAPLSYYEMFVLSNLT